MRTATPRRRRRRHAARRLPVAAIVAAIALSSIAPSPIQPVSAQAPECVVRSSDLLGWWSGDGLAATVGPDLVGAASASTGIIGGALSFAGTGTGAVAPAFPAASSGVTVGAWIRPARTGLVQTVIARWDDPGNDDGARSFALLVDVTGDLLWLTDETSALRPDELRWRHAGIDLFDGSFHHVAASWDPTQIAIYVDGELVASRPSLGGTLNAASATPVRLGAKDGVGDPFAFAGSLDEIVVVDRALSATEVERIVAAGGAAFCTIPAAFPAAISSTGRYLVDGQGRPYMIHGDAAWSLVVEPTAAEAESYLDDRAAKGFNLLLVSVLEHAFTSHPPLNAAGAAPFVGRAFGTPNEAYFQHLDLLVDRAARRGITLLFVPAYLGYGGGTEGWYSEIVAASDADMRTFGEFLGNRYRNAPNIMWALGGDYNPPALGQQRMDALAAGVTATDPGHLVTAHTSREHTAAEIWGSSTWLDVDNVYSHFAADTTASAYGATPVRPVFFIEGVYENEQGAPVSRVRGQAWATLLSGASGQIFGNNPIWHFASGGLYPTDQTWQQALAGPGSLHMAVLHGFFESIPWYRLTPDRTDQYLVAGESSGLDRAAAAVSVADGLGVVSVPSARTIRLNLAVLAPGSVRLRWFDPTAGTYRAVGTFTAAGQRDLVTPGLNAAGDADWVLVADRAA